MIHLEGSYRAMVIPKGKAVNNSDASIVFLRNGRTGRVAASRKSAMPHGAGIGPGRGSALVEPLRDAMMPRAAVLRCVSALAG